MVRKKHKKLSAQIWRKNENKVTSVFLTNKKAVSIQLDPMRETADIDESNNKWPNVSAPSKFTIIQNERFWTWSIDWIVTNAKCTKQKIT